MTAVGAQVTTQSGTPGSDVVLGDDWVRPQSAVDTEVRIHRARRGLFSIFQSPLARKIILFNMLALVLLVAGVLFTNPFRDSLARQHEVALVTQAEGLADVMGVLPALVPDAGAYPTADARRLRAGTLDALTLNAETEVLLLDADGRIETARRGSGARSSTPLDALEVDQHLTVISDILDAIWSGLAAVVPGDRSPQPDPATLLAELHAEAMQGHSSSRVLRLDDGFRMLAAAPVLVDGQPVGSVVMQQIPETIEHMLRSEREQVLQMFIVALLVSVGLSLVLASTIANPLADLATAAELGRDKNARRMSPGRVRIPDLTGRPDEIGRLSSAMRGMVTALYDRIDANEQFAADVAHEIKNPLASLRSAVGTLRVAKREDQVTRLLDVIEHDVRRLDRLISDTSNASRLDSELVKEEEETFNLCKTLDNLSQHLAQEAEAKGVEFITELPRDAIMIQGLEARLAQVFVNLITNAISFCGEGDAVRIWARKRENRVLVVVEDTGPGIPEAALTKVFKRFYSERPQDFGNHSGLGLAISKQIVEAHGGVIWAENIRPTNADRNSPPLGARFVVGLPL
ncbi:sensor histidine kinase [Pararhodobacter aggregans]|uniref:histidine kinase n=1 Tax=Pararhodobacter aggregans TaxID=404875 RepID=A0A2T7URV2_9RHOB|nr:sensor histidine kinase [Pararhodobacter aggregans]PTX00335.1 two-component system sensor histidine kinase ChvG [Pararhodobacter aggregans]PVE47321.1 histidine kinase [Pararhodobacter aggregans]